MKIAIVGATGFVGTGLIEKLKQEQDNVVVLSRNLEKAKRLFPSEAFPNLEIADLNTSESLTQILSQCDGVVNLAGEPIAERWTPEYKQQIISSRQQTTAKIVQAIAAADSKPKVLVNASAIGYYGTSETTVFDETSAPGNDFLAEVCQKWEAEAKQVQEVGVRLVILRLGIVLGNGGALGKMIPPFKIFAGGPLGNGRQWFSWIHIDDLINLIIYALKNPHMQGTFNATAPTPVRMNQLCQTLGEVLKRPSWLPVPAFALDVMLGEAAKVVLEGQQVLPKQTQATGFQYQYPTLKPALTEIISKL